MIRAEAMRRELVAIAAAALGALGSLASPGSGSRALAGECGDAGEVEARFDLICSPDVVHPGGEFTVTLSIVANRPVQGYRFLMDWDEEWMDLLGARPLYARPQGGAFEIEEYELNGDSLVPNPRHGGETPEEGFIRGNVLFDSTDRSFDIPSGQATPVFEATFRPSAQNERTGARFWLIDEYGNDFGVRVHNAAEICGESVRPFITPGRECTIRVKPPGECLAPDETAVEWALGNVIATPGSEIVVPFHMQASERIDGFAYSIDFDEEVLEALSLDFVFRRQGGEPWDFQRVTINNENETEGSGGVDEGSLAGGVVFDLFHGAITLPPHVRHHVIDLRFRVRPETGAVSTEVKFLNGALGYNDNPWANNSVSCGTSIEPIEANSFVFINGIVGIIDEITVFRRGDANGDGKVDMSDAVGTLSYLFQGGGRPACYDAADANDDGEIDLSDPVAILGVLFLGAGEIPPPSAEPGEDPTPDALRCIGRSSST